MNNTNRAGITWQEITKAVLLGLSGITLGVSEAAKEILFDRIDARNDEAWKARMEQIVLDIQQTHRDELSALATGQRIVALSHLVETIPNETVQELKNSLRSFQRNTYAPGSKEESKFWENLAQGLEQIDKTRLKENLTNQLTNIQQAGEKLTLSFIASIPIGRQLLALLNGAEAECQARDTVVRTPNILLALLGSGGGFTFRCFEALRPGLGTDVTERLRYYVHMQAKEGDHEPYHPFDWAEREEIRWAQRLAFAEAYPLVNERYFLMALLTAESPSVTIQQLRTYLEMTVGAGSFERFQEIIRKTPIHPSYRGTPGKVF